MSYNLQAEQMQDAINTLKVERDRYKAALEKIEKEVGFELDSRPMFPDETTKLAGKIWKIIKPFFEPAVTPAATGHKQPEPWMQIGKQVLYHPIIDRPLDSKIRVIESEPWQVGHRQWVVKISGTTGGVALEAISHIAATGQKEGT